MPAGSPMKTLGSVVHCFLSSSVPHAFAFALLAFGLSFTRASAAAPNLIIFFADDLGWGELGCQGNKEIPTPNIDSLATNGIRFTQGYVAATYCSPSRAG